MSSPYYNLLKNKIDMTQEQIEFINAITDVHLRTFLRLKEEQFNNVWSAECERLFVETQMGIIHIAENYLLQPVRTFNPHQLTFTRESEPIRVEIADSITEIFSNWRQHN